MHPQSTSMQHPNKIYQMKNYLSFSINEHIELLFRDLRIISQIRNQFWTCMSISLEHVFVLREITLCRNKQPKMLKHTKRDIHHSLNSSSKHNLFTSRQQVLKTLGRVKLGLLFCSLSFAGFWVPGIWERNGNCYICILLPIKLGSALHHKCHAPNWQRRGTCVLNRWPFHNHPAHLFLTGFVCLQSYLQHLF